MIDIDVPDRWLTDDHGLVVADVVSSTVRVSTTADTVVYSEYIAA